MIVDAQNFSVMQSAATLGGIPLEEFLVKDKKFPSVKNIKVLFRRLGLVDLSQKLSRRTRSNFDLSLQSFMDVRNALAHESPPSITDVDVNLYFTRIACWVDAIDREFYSHVVSTSGSAYW
jgi:hypothetical protein